MVHGPALLAVIAAYDVLKPDKEGKPTKSLIRSTCLIDKDGVIIAEGGHKLVVKTKVLSALSLGYNKITVENPVTDHQGPGADRE